ncbi:unnamed protein product [Calicophoron daubneyi]|uniref:Uncharacterized protein n=1 Tax=Calicophoron daubneyi TaxID=300641 RepID=A0AAV2TA70_CALDB
MEVRQFLFRDECCIPVFQHQLTSVTTLARLGSRKRHMFILVSCFFGPQVLLALGARHSPFVLNLSTPPYMHCLHV